MNNFIFKSANRLIKNSPITLDNLMRQLRTIQEQNRYLRQDCLDINHKLDRLLVDKHLQMQVDEYFDRNDPEKPPTGDLD